MINLLLAELKDNSNPEKAKVLQRFFKTGKGEYAEGDIFLGVMVPEQREIAKKYDLSLEDLQKLLQSKIHEHRLVALFILIGKFKKASEKEKARIYNFYLKNTKHINSWDLIDLSAEKIIGKFLVDKERSVIHKLAKSSSLWEKRIAMLATFEFIKNNDFKDAFTVAEIFLNDKHDLIHKAVGWMLREIGKRDLSAEESFLKKRYKKMPRTMLRYAIEKFPEEKRRFYLKK